MIATTNKMNDEYLNSHLPSKQVGFKTVVKCGKNRKLNVSPEFTLSFMGKMDIIENCIKMKNQFDVLDKFLFDMSMNTI